MTFAFRDCSLLSNQNTQLIFGVGEDWILDFFIWQQKTLPVKLIENHKDSCFHTKVTKQEWYIPSPIITNYSTFLNEVSKPLI